MPMRLGELLCEANIVSKEMINYALNIQKATGSRLGDTLKSLKLATDYDIATVLATQAGLEYTDLDEVNPSITLIGNIPQDIARKYEALPIGRHDKELLIAISDPFNEEMKKKIESVLIDKHRFVVAPKSTLIRKIEHVYYLATHPLAEKIHSMAKAYSQGEPFHEDKLVELIIQSAIDHRASDIHINASEVATMVSYRIDGVLQLLYALPSAMHTSLVAKIKQQCKMDIAERHRSQNAHIDFVFLSEKYDLRTSTIPTSQGENVVIRLMSADSPIRSLAELGFSVKHRNTLNHMVVAPYGLILSVGPTGTGKTTTLYSMARKINLMQKNLMSIEDPIEYEMPLVKQTSVNEKVGITYSSAIRDFLRHDPDALLVGEIRDEETAKLAMRAAQTGHLVLSTIHSNDASSAVSRLRELGVNSMMIASSLAGIVAQRLARKLCRHCCKPVKLSDADRKRLNLSRTNVMQHVGCQHCHQTGYTGRTVVAEILEIDDEFRSLIDLGGSQLEIQEMARRKKIQSLAKAGIELIESGKIDIAEFFRIIRPSVHELGASDI